MFNSILSESVTIENFLICMATSLVLGFIVAFLHMKTGKSNKNFTTTLAILPSLVATVILLINGNLGTGIAVAGAFTLIRFRSIPGNSREIMNVFFAMAIGLAVGTGYVAFAALFTIIIALVIVILDLIKFGDGKAEQKILKIVIPEDLDYTECFDAIFNKYLDTFELRQAKTINMGSMFELTYLVNIKNETNEKDLIDKIRVKNGNLKVSLTHPLIEDEL